MSQEQKEFVEGFEHRLKQMYREHGQKPPIHLQTPLQLLSPSTWLAGGLTAQTPAGEKLSDLARLLQKEFQKNPVNMSVGVSETSSTQVAPETINTGVSVSASDISKFNMSMMPGMNLANNPFLANNFLSGLLSPAGTSSSDEANVLIPLMVSGAGANATSVPGINVSLASLASGSFLLAAHAASTARFQQHLAADGSINLAPITTTTQQVVQDPRPSISDTAVRTRGDSAVLGQATPPLDPVPLAQSQTSGIANGPMLVSSVEAAPRKPKVVIPVATHPVTGYPATSFMSGSGHVGFVGQRPSSAAGSVGGASLAQGVRPDRQAASSVDMKRVLQSQVLDPDSQEILKIERKRARNRAAATRCRTRKLEKIKMLEEEVALLNREIQEVKEKYRMVAQERAGLQKRLNEHKLAGCAVDHP